MKFYKGMDLPVLVIEDVQRSAMKVIAALMNDPNPIHLDGGAVADLGLGSVPINQGPITISYLQAMISSATGSSNAIRRFEARFLANVFAGDRVECTGTVREIDEGQGIAILDCQASVGAQVVISAVATVEVPTAHLTHQPVNICVDMDTARS